MPRAPTPPMLVVLSALLSLLAPFPAAADTAAARPLPADKGSSLPLPDDASVELHAHLFMKEAMTWAFKGDFAGPLQAENWQARFSSEANPEAVERSGIRILVVALYAHPLFSLSLRDSVRRQIDLAGQFVATHPNWVIARTPGEAKMALQKNQRVLILALEGAAGVLESEEDLKEFVDEKRIRIVTLLHLSDDRFGGVGFLAGYRGLSAPFSWLQSAFGNFFHPAEDGVLHNSHGLTEAGRQLTRALIKRGVWVDLAHASDVSQKELIPMLKEGGQPILYTHTSLRKYLGAERGIAPWQLEQVRLTGGIVGLLPSEEMVFNTPPDPSTVALAREHCPGACPPGASLCNGGGVHALKVHYDEIASQIGGDSTLIGSDYNGGIIHLKPACATGTSLDLEGLWNIGQQGDLWKALRAAGAKVPDPLSRTVTRFLQAWSRLTDR